MSIEPIEPAGRRVTPFRGRQTQGEISDPDAVAGADTGEDQGTGKAPALGVLGKIVSFALAAVIVAPVTLSASHLIKWAHEAAPKGLGLPTYLAGLVFVAMDMAAIVCIGQTIIRARRGEGSGKYGIMTWAFALASAYSNYTGSTGAGQWFFPLMSLSGPALLEMVLGDIKRWVGASDGTRMSAKPKFGIRWIPGIAFNETRRAWAAARRENIGKAADAIAFVREVDVLKEMADADAVQYARAAARTTDPYELRQWLTSRGKDVAQAELPAVPERYEVDDDVFREGGPLPLAPMPHPLRASREALGLPAAPEPLTEKPTPRPRPRPRPRARAPKNDSPVDIRRPRQQDHPRWADAEAAYRKSIEVGAKLSQRKLSDTLKIHRTLAKAVIAHVDDELFPEG